MSSPEFQSIIRSRDDVALSTAAGGGVPPEIGVVVRRAAEADEPEVWPDLLSAIRNYWLANPSLTQISPDLYLNEAPANPTYPFATFSSPAEKPSFNTGPGYWESKVIKFAIYSTDDFQLLSYSDWLTGAYDPLNRSKALYFRNGYLMGFLRQGGEFGRMPNLVKGKYVWRQSYTYLVTVGRTQ